jgi:beta-galactosidase
MGTATVWLPLEDGLNRFFVQSGAPVDVLEIDHLAQKPMLKDGFSQLNVLLGSARSFTESGICWVPEKEYAPGSWGYVGGEAYRPKSGDSTLPAAEISILGTDSDPMYQTQRRGLETFRADVPDGKYAVYLHWAELVRPGAEKLLYNLGRDSIYDGGSERIFSVSVNGTSIHEQLNVLEEVGPARPFVTKVDVTVEDGEGICVGFKPCDQGQTMLTAVRIVKLD